MFDTLSEKLGAAFRSLKGKGRLSEKDVDASLREVRLALLEADVNFRVVRDFVSRIRERALGEELLKSLNPGQRIVTITNEELTNILGGAVNRLEIASSLPTVVCMVGLNGSGKTTTAAKLAVRLKKSGGIPVLIAADLHRPAAMEQLETLGNQAFVSVYGDHNSKSPVHVARDGVAHAKELRSNWAIIDTAGRFQIDDELMVELEDIKGSVAPHETLLVVDAMTGQEAVDVAEEFHSRIGLTGLVLTKLDGDARGGAALSIVATTGLPIKFIGNGEGLEALDQFHPDRLASRILGMGDILTLAEKAQGNFDEQQAFELQRKMQKATFDLEDFLGQLQQLRKMGPLTQILDMVPGMSSIKGRLAKEEIGDDKIKKVEALIYSMTAEERRKPEIIGGSRRRRIAQGSGSTTQDVNQLLNQFQQIRKTMRQISSGKGIEGLSKLLR